MLVQERRGLDETEETLVVAPCAKPLGRERQVLDVGDDHGDRVQESGTLGVVMALQDLLTVGQPQARDASGLALALVDAGPVCCSDSSR